jgi:hypothetical protein
MSWVERSVEERLANAAAGGELDTPHLKGKQLDLDTQRGQGWWADQFTRRELSHDRRRVAEEAAQAARVGFWRANDVDELRELVQSANDAISRANINLVEADRLPPFDPADIERRWERLHRAD